MPKTPYNYEARYDETHDLLAVKTKKTVQLGRWNKVSVCLCPYCLRLTNLGRTPNRPKVRWMEAHHATGYNRQLPWWLTYVPACVECHLGPGGDRRRSKLHHPKVWMVNRRNPDLSRNTFWFTQWIRLRWLILWFTISSIKATLRLFRPRR